MRMIPAILLGLAACAVGLSDKGSRVRWAQSKDEISGCEWLGVVQGQTNYSDQVSNLSETYARNDALNKAGDKGATHVLWLDVGKNSADAEAYRCPETKYHRPASPDSRRSGAQPRRRLGAREARAARPIRLTRGIWAESTPRSTAVLVLDVAEEELAAVLAARGPRRPRGAHGLAAAAPGTGERHGLWFGSEHARPALAGARLSWSAAATSMRPGRRPAATAELTEPRAVRDLAAAGGDPVGRRRPVRGAHRWRPSRGRSVAIGGLRCRRRGCGGSGARALEAPPSRPGPARTLAVELWSPRSTR